MSGVTWETTIQRPRTTSLGPGLDPPQRSRQSVWPIIRSGFAAELVSRLSTTAVQQHTDSTYTDSLILVYCLTVTPNLYSVCPFGVRSAFFRRQLSALLLPLVWQLLENPSASTHLRYWGGQPLSSFPSPPSSRDFVAVMAGVQRIDSRSNIGGVRTPMTPAALTPMENRQRKQSTDGWNKNSRYLPLCPLQRYTAPFNTTHKSVPSGKLQSRRLACGHRTRLVGSRPCKL